MECLDEYIVWFPGCSWYYQEW